MKVVLLAGGLGTRLQEETRLRPKPMVEIGGKPILWHIMKHFKHYGHEDFIVACGYMGDFIKSYFMDQYHVSGDLEIDFRDGSINRSDEQRDNWVLNFIDTGATTNTGGRVHRLKRFLSDGTFLLTYGDGVSNIDLAKLLAFHRSEGRIATVTAVRPPARFGGLDIHDGKVSKFSEKPCTGEGWINGGFMAMEPEIFDYLHSDECSLESNALERVAQDGQLSAYCHEGFWQCMDTLRDKQMLESLHGANEAPWMMWKNSQRQTLRVVPARRAA